MRFVILKKVACEGGVKFDVACVTETPPVPKDKVTGKPVYGPMIRGLKTVKQVVQETGLSKNKAQDLLRTNPLACLVDLEGQEPLFGLTAGVTNAPAS